MVLQNSNLELKVDRDVALQSECLGSTLTNWHETKLQAPGKLGGVHDRVGMNWDQKVLLSLHREQKQV